MAKGIARYMVTYGLSGCYMPDSSYPIEFTRRRDLVAFVKSEIEALDWPANVIKQVPLRRVWAHIAKHGSSSAHFSFDRAGHQFGFHGLTDAEYKQESESED